MSNDNPEWEKLLEEIQEAFPDNEYPNYVINRCFDFVDKAYKIGEEDAYKMAERDWLNWLTEATE